MSEEKNQQLREKIKEENTESLPQEEIEELKKHLKEAQEKYLRVLADSENARKRMQKEREDLTKYAVENILSDFLHPLDNLEKALEFAENMSEEVQNWAAGFKMLLGQFQQILSNHGVEQYRSIGESFDPHLHEAVEMEETADYKPGVIIEEFVRGYKIGNRPIRVARVKVTKAPPVNKKDIDTKQEG
ncbi:MAG: nucleotide exchange factor GrpE [Chlamydiales bacterium]